MQGKMVFWKDHYPPRPAHALDNFSLALASWYAVKKKIINSIADDNSLIQQAAPGICDGISARCALEAGFEVLYQR